MHLGLRQRSKGCGSRLEYGDGYPASNPSRRRWLHKVVGTACVGLALVTSVSGNAHAQQQDPTLLYQRDGLTIRWHLQAGINYVIEENLFWNLSQTFAPTSGFDPDTEWFESYARPGLSFEQKFAGPFAICVG
jgi:hypothetical protein